MDPSYFYPDMYYTRQHMYADNHLYDEFSKEDSQLLLSVLNSTPAQEQNMLYYPSEYYMRYETYYPNVMLSNNGNETRVGKSDTETQNSMSGSYNTYYNDEKMSYYKNFLNQYNGYMKDIPSQLNVPSQNRLEKQTQYYINNESKLETVQSNNFDFKQQVIKIRSDVQTEFKSDDSDNSIDIQKSRRRESQNRASRNYRQRKKAYIKEIEEKLEQLRLENENLRNENQKNRRIINQFRSLIDKPPLIRSYSSELMVQDQEIEKIVNRLNRATSEKSNNEEELRNLLHLFHEHVSKRQNILQKEVFQFINPKMQEKIVRLEGVPPRQVETKLNEWLYEASQFVSQEQIQKLNELKQRHYESRSKIWEERNKINREIKDFYQKKLASEKFCKPQKPDPESIQILTNKLEELKKNLTKESDLNIKSVEEFSNILTPHQEAFITIKHYNLYKEKVSAFQMLNNVWSFLSSNESKSS